MTYSTGNTILAADYNTFRTSVDDIFGDTNSASVVPAAMIFGYGETMLQAAVAAGNTVTAAHWNLLVNMIHRCAGHQGSTIVLAGSVTAAAVAAGANIAPITNLAASITEITNNKLLFNAGNMTTATKNTHTGTAGWTTSSTHTFTQTFTSYDAARHYYNQGGGALFTASRSGGSSNAQNTDWTNMLTAIGTVTIGANTTTNSGGTGTNGDSFDDVASNATATRTMYTKTGSGQYSSNQYKIQCACDAAKVVYSWTVTFNDAHSNEPWSDTVDGNLVSTMQERRATGTYVNSATATYSTGGIAQT